jgi:hypothetical protein
MIQTLIKNKLQNSSNHKDLEMEISRLWKRITKSVPVILGAIGTIKKRLDQNLLLLPGHLLATQVQKITLMSTTHVIRKVLG